MFLNQFHTVCPKIETKLKLRNSNVFSAQKQVVSKKKKVFIEIESDFLARIGNLNVFSAPKQVVSKKKKTKTKKTSLPKLRLIFRPKSEIHTFFQAESQHVLRNFGTQFPLGGAVFNFSPKIGLKSNKNVRFCILYKQWRIQKISVGGDFKHISSKIRMSSPELRVIFQPKSEIQTFFLPKIRWSPKKKKKKRSSPGLRVIFQPRSENLTFFSPKIGWSPKKKKRSLPESLGCGWWGGMHPEMEPNCSK